ncbi:MAG: PAS domain S-box protein, partial [Nitrospirae bacterium]|nr:PAS domain S-box protein [Nitrospirota bacterium]
MEITNKRIIRTTNILALVLSVSVTVLLPLGYFVLSYQYQAAVLETEAEAGAYFINRLINTNPDFWRYSQHRLEGALSYHLSKEYEEAKRIVGLDNKLIASNQVSVPAPVMTRSHDLFDSGAVAARLEISSSIRPLLKNTALFGALGFFLGSVGFISFKMFPSRALSGTLKLLSESEEKFRAITTTAVDGIIVMDNKGSITYWNPAAERMFGYSQAEAVGRELHIFLAPRKYHEMYKKGFNGFRATGQGPAIGKTLEFIAVKKDGTEFPIEVSTSTISIKGEWHAVGLVHDITQRKNAERDLAEMYEAKRDEAEISASLLQFVETLSTSLEEKELVRNILDLAPGYLKFNRMSLYFYDDEAKCFAFAGAYGLSPAGKEMLGAKKIKPGDFPAIDIIMKGQAVIIDKAEEY